MKKEILFFGSFFLLFYFGEKKRENKNPQKRIKETNIFFLFVFSLFLSKIKNQKEKYKEKAFLKKG